MARPMSCLVLVVLLCAIPLAAMAPAPAPAPPPPDRPIMPGDPNDPVKRIKNATVTTCDACRLTNELIHERAQSRLDHYEGKMKAGVSAHLKLDLEGHIADACTGDDWRGYRPELQRLCRQMIKPAANAAEWLKLWRGQEPLGNQVEWRFRAMCGYRLAACPKPPPQPDVPRTACDACAAVIEDLAMMMRRDKVPTSGATATSADRRLWSHLETVCSRIHWRHAPRPKSRRNVDDLRASCDELLAEHDADIAAAWPGEVASVAAGGAPGHYICAQALHLCPSSQAHPSQHAEL